MPSTVPINKKMPLKLLHLRSSVEGFIYDHSAVKPFLQAIPQLVRQIYGEIPMSLSVHTDPEEGWRRLVLSLSSGVNDADKRTRLENALFDRLAADESSLAALEFVVVSQG